MKKVIITLLLVLPFILIYFISFTGQILAKYSYIPVERIALLDENGDELTDKIIRRKKGETYQMRIKVFPEYASNKKYKISNSNSEACPINEIDKTILAKDYGETVVIITSNDKHYVQCMVRFKVAQEELEDIKITLDGNELNDNAQLNVGVGKAKNLGVKIIPNTTVLENRDIVWTSSNTDYVRVNSNGQIIGIKVTTEPIIVTATSVFNANIKRSILINVTEELEKGVWFYGNEVDKLYTIPVGEFDLKTITKIVDLPSDIVVTYKITIGNDPTKLDSSQLNDGIIVFNQVKTAIEVKLTATHEGVTYTDTIRIKTVSAG